jgi:hypothetical protein
LSFAIAEKSLVKSVVEMEAAPFALLVFDDELLPPPVAAGHQTHGDDRGDPYHRHSLQRGLHVASCVSERVAPATEELLLDPGPRQSNSNTSLRPIPGEDPHAST